MRVQLVVAHPDDETFGCGSLLLHLAAAGATTAVCCATRGEAGEIKAGSSLTPAELGAARESELRSAAVLMGVRRVDLLGFVDSGMSGPAATDTLVGAPLDRVIESVHAAIDGFEPDVVVTLDASDGHRDHERIREATVTAALAAGVPRIYLNALPRSLMQRWAEAMQAEQPDREHLATPTTTLGVPDEEITTVIDASVHFESRKTAIAAHTSQSSPFDGLPEDLAYAFLSTSHLIRVEPPWTGGPLETELV